MIVSLFVTLGPGTNHEKVAGEYLAFHGLGPDALGFVASAEEGAGQLLSGEAEFMILCSVHPDVVGLTGRHMRDLFAIDAFISPSKPLAIATRCDAPAPKRIGVFAPTRDYADLSAWPHVVERHRGSIVDIWRGLRDGEFESGLVYREDAEAAPDFVRVVRDVGSPDDAWIVFSRTRAWTGRILACKRSAVSARLSGMGPVHARR
ncbi:hypothetical protein [Bosea sp. (in: a-proteobacteria)]|uniref:hypothetical protein n=1 Tax=Bosea sp. (in: a-proteobacteria) TaxID=1871050 RepID=UPI0025C4A6A3|nr:hypothetical protein [Bosea sp. (in: a-proteobacteria)]